MAKNEVLISVDELKRLEACEGAMLLSGLICPNCGYDNSTPVEEWKQNIRDTNNTFTTHKHYNINDTVYFTN